MDRGQCDGAGSLSNGIAAELDRSRAVKLDMAGVSELDTLGAWLLEKISRRASSVPNVSAFPTIMPA